MGCTAPGTELHSNRSDCRVSEEGRCVGKRGSNVSVNAFGFPAIRWKQVQPERSSHKLCLIEGCIMASAVAAPIVVEEVSQRNAVSFEVGSITITHEQITQRAHKIWEREGKIGGRDQEHWFQAIAELTSETDGDDEDDVFCGIPRTVRTPKQNADW